MIPPLFLWCIVIIGTCVADTTPSGAAALCSVLVPTVWSATITATSILGAMLALLAYLQLAIDFVTSALHVCWTDSFYNRPSRREWGAYIRAVRRVAAHSLGGLTAWYLPQLHLNEQLPVVCVGLMLLGYSYLQPDRTQGAAAASKIPGTNRTARKQGWRYRHVLVPVRLHFATKIIQN